MVERSSRWWLRQDSQSVVVEAPAERIYALVADLPRMGEWSPECQRVEWVGRVERTRPRAPRSSATTGAAPRPHEVVAPGSRPRPPSPAASSPSSPRRAAGSRPCGATASSRPTAGTRVTESYEVKWIPTWARIVDVPTNRPASCATAMRHTLEQLKRAAEARRRRRRDPIPPTVPRPEETLMITPTRPRPTSTS